MRSLNSILATCLIYSFATLTSFVNASAVDAEKLSSTLTPLGAELAGNGRDIPAWSANRNISNNQVLEDDRPLVVLTSKNYKQYQPFLSDGQKALFERYPDSFRMPIYPTRRTANAPDWVYKNTHSNALNSQLVADGNGIANAYGGIPFPIPATGLEVIWNHIARWRGTYIEYRAASANVDEEGRIDKSLVDVEVEFNYYRNDQTIEQLNNILFYLIAEIKEPVREAGSALLIHEPLNQSEQARNAWAYNAGQRRVRRAPNINYDAPVAAAADLRVADETDMFNGSPDRYQWQLLGKQELYIPYNNQALAKPSLSLDELLTPYHLNPEFTRYEKHRVWVVEASLKDDVRHIYKRRRFYIDEDTWGIAVADLYDGKDELWRVSMAYHRDFPSVPASWSGGLDVYHDLRSRRYHATGLVNDNGKTLDFSAEPPGPRHFTVGTLRRRGRR